MKKQNSFLAAGIALLLTSCYGDYMPGDSLPATVPLTVKVTQPWTTRASVNPGDDMKLDSIKVFVFDKDGNLEYVDSNKSNAGTTTIGVIPGLKKIWVLGNLNDGNSSRYNVKDEKAFLALFKDLGDNSLDRMIMSGSTEVQITTASTVSVSISHLACKIVLDKIERNFINKQFGQIPMKIMRIYMGNVAGSCNFDGTARPTYFYNRFCVIGDSLPGTLRTLTVENNINKVLPDGESYEATHTFYVYPNPTVQDSSTDRCTRLVVECEYNGQICYYPITLPKLEGDERGVLVRNTEYHISNLTLRRPGATNPEDPDSEVSSYVNATFNITVSDWTGGTAYTEVYQ